MENKFVAFDIEITKEIPDGLKDWKSIRPLGISCAATMRSDQTVPSLWHGDILESGMYSPSMSSLQCKEMFNCLKECQDGGFPVVTWNGLSFDFDILTEECLAGEADKVLYGHQRRIAIDVAMNHIDMMFQMVCEKGYPVGLDNTAKGMGLKGKTEGMHGDLAPKMWAESREKQDKVLEYVAQDVIATADVFRNISSKGYISWIAKSGKTASHWLKDRRLHKVSECLKFPFPDTSWMTGSAGRTRESYYEWTK